MRLRDLGASMRCMSLKMHMMQDAYVTYYIVTSNVNIYILPAATSVMS
jgi:hypothetical protein